jgi:ribose 5-phosphate isomerase A
VPVVGLSQELVPLELYVDGADEADAELRLIKGAGGALAREKVLASAAKRFVCIADESKLVAHLGRGPVPVEVMTTALYFVRDRLRILGGNAILREGFESDNGNPILDVHGLDLGDPEALEDELEAIPGVIACGMFARRPADILIVGTQRGARTIERSAAEE